MYKMWWSRLDARKKYMVVGAISILCIIILVWYLNRTPATPPSGTLPPVACTTDAQCSSGKCDTTKQICMVACKSNGDCSGGLVCNSTTGLCGACDLTANLCSPPSICSSGICTSKCGSNTDCSGGLVCDPSTSMCVACDLTANFCSTPDACVSGVCTTTCATSDQCGTYACNPTTNKCIAPCASNKDCGSQVCNPATRLCVSCDTTSNFCTSGQICDSTTGCGTGGCTSTDQCGSQVCNALQQCVRCDDLNVCDIGKTCYSGVCDTTVDPANRKAIFYHQQWSIYGNVDLNGNAPAGAMVNGFNVATSLGRNYQISDIPDDVTDIAYAFWWVDQTGRVASGDDWADHEKPLVVDGKNTPQPPAPTAPNLDASTSPCGSAYQYPVTRGAVGPQGTFANFGNFGAILALNTARRARNVPKLNVSLTIGGWSFSMYFSDAVKPANQQNFVTSCLNALTTWSDIFTGINFDWEYISDNGANWGATGTVFPAGNKTSPGTTTPSNHTDPSDVDNFVSFLGRLRSALTANGYFTTVKPFTIGIPVTPAPEKAQYDINRIHQLVDQIHIMSYDMHSGAFDSVTGFHTNPKAPTSITNYPTPAYSTEDAIKYYLGLSGQVSDNPNQRGFIGAGGDPSSPVPLPNVPPSKLFLGVAFYSRGFAHSQGIYTPTCISGNDICGIDKLPQAVYAPGDSNSIPYNQVVTLCSPTTTPTGDWGIIQQDVAGGTHGAYCYNQAESQFLSFDSPESITAKLALVVQYNLGGVIVWDNASDIRGAVSTDITDPTQPRTSLPESLTHAITKNLYT